jgi:saccharopine dehydrogenase-like NADP-dependent oxidoreductase
MNTYKRSDTMQDGRILVVGGYGAVDRVIRATLSESFPGRVIAAGRSYEKAQVLATTTQHRVVPAQLDLFEVDENSTLWDGVSLVVMCLDQPDTRFVELCLQKGIDYVDITATYDFLAKVEALETMAKTSGSTVVLSVGIAPGLTNLLARHAQSQFDEMPQVDIHILLGLGEAHGDAAIRWAVENFNTEFTVYEAGKAKRVHSIEDGKQTTFPGKLGRRTTYRFNFSDQHVLPRTLGLDSVSTRIAFDSTLMTNLLAFLKKVGLFKLLRYQWARDGMVKLLQIFRFGTEQFVAQVDAQGKVDGQQRIARYAVAGQSEARFTGLVAAQVAHELLTGNFASGVHHIEQLFEPLAFITKLGNAGLDFFTPNNKNNRDKKVDSLARDVQPACPA